MMVTFTTEQLLNSSALSLALLYRGLLVTYLLTYFIDGFHNLISLFPRWIIVIRYTLYYITYLLTYLLTAAFNLRSSLSSS